jgi:hypothetical protein
MQSHLCCLEKGPQGLIFQYSFGPIDKDLDLNLSSFL